MTIKQVCDGMDISLREFFDSPIFDELSRKFNSRASSSRCAASLI